MPTYDYECLKCGYRFEVFQSIKEAPKKSCPECKGRVKRQFGTGAGLLFKGSGFYSTDYRSSGYKAAAKKDAPAPATTTSDSGKPSATKSASKD